MFSIKTWSSHHISQIMIALASVVSAVLVVEVILNVLQYPYIGCGTPVQVEETAFGHFDPLTGWSYNSYVTYYNDGVQYTFNKWGIRVNNALQEIDMSKPRILFIGDSVTFGYGLNYEDTFAAKIGKLLGDQYEVVNLGVQGYGTDQTLLRMREFIGTLQPKVIIYTFIPDHLDRNINSDRRQLLRCISFHGTKLLFDVIQQRGQETLRQVRYPQPSLQRDTFKTLLLVQNIADRVRTNQWKQTGQDLKITKALVKQIAQEAELAKAKPYFIYYDNIYDPSPHSLNNLLVKQIFTDQGLKVSPTLNFAVDPHGDYYVPVSHYHPNSKITSLIAQNFYTQFGPELKQLASSSSVTH